jgi:hypothetical protein
MSDWQAFSNYYYQLSVERSNISHYLQQKSQNIEDYELVELCMQESNLFDQESILWKNVSILFNEFMKKGFFISMPKSVKILTDMSELITEIIVIEEKIIHK